MVRTLTYYVRDVLRESGASFAYHPSQVLTFTDSLTRSITKPGTGSDYYVDTNHASASDSNAGTSEDAPWKTIHKACATLVAGETAWVKNGTYVCESNSDWHKPSLNPANSGTDGNPICFRAYPGHTPLLTSSLAGPYCLFGSEYQDYIEWDGFECDGNQVGYRGCVVWEANYCVIENCTIHGFHHPSSDNCDGIRIENSTYCTLKRNLIYDVQAPSHFNAAGIKVYDCFYLTIENNEVYGCRAGIFDKRGSSYDTVRYNWCYDNDEYGILMGASSGKTSNGFVVHHNITSGSAICGILISGSSNSPNRDAQIYSNTCTDSVDRCIYVETDISGTADCWNNILTDGNNNIAASTSVIDECDHNHFYNTTTGCGSSGDPKFVGGAGVGAYKLDTGSPCIGTGRDGVDIGAYETGSETIGRY